MTGPPFPVRLLVRRARNAKSPEARREAARAAWETSARFVVRDGAPDVAAERGDAAGKGQTPSLDGMSAKEQTPSFDARADAEGGEPDVAERLAALETAWEEGQFLPRDASLVFVESVDVEAGGRLRVRAVDLNGAVPRPVEEKCRARKEELHPGRVHVRRGAEWRSLHPHVLYDGTETRERVLFLLPRGGTLSYLDPASGEGLAGRALTALFPTIEADVAEVIPGLAGASSEAAPSVSLSRAPASFGQYRILGDLHRGGTGTVHLALQEASGRRVALVTQPQAVHDEVTRARFLREVRAFARCDHPGVVKVLACGEVGGKPYFCAELVEGASLEDLPFESPEQRTSDLATFFREAALAVGALHEAGVLHRDLRPDRLVVTSSDRRVVVLEPDFATIAGAGTALAQDPETRIASLRLSPPEQLGESLLDLDARADIYSLGATFHEVLSGRPFLDPADEEELEDQVTLASPPPAHVVNPAVPRALSAILQTCTAKERGDRYPDVASLVRDLTAFMEGRPVAARPPPALHRARLAVRRHRRWLSVAGGLGTIALAAGAAFFFARAAPHACAEGDLADCSAQCEKGSSASCATLGLMFQSGHGAEKDLVRATEHHERACDAGSAAGCVGLGLILSAEGHPPEDLVRARDALQRACDQDDPRGCDALGLLLTEGRGGVADAAQAAALHDRACRAQYPVACGHLGALTEHGLGVVRDPSRARVFYMRACSEGAPAWCAVTAETLVEGRGGEKDEAQAARLFDRACAAGVLEGCAGLGKLLLRGGGVQKDEPLGRALSKRACDGGVLSACEAASQ